MSSIGVTYNSNLCTYRALLHVLAYAAQRQHTPYDIVHDALMGGVVTAFGDREGRIHDTVLLPSSKCMSTVAPLIEEGFFTSYSACTKQKVPTAGAGDGNATYRGVKRYSVWSEGDMCDNYSLIVLLFPDCFVEGPTCASHDIVRGNNSDGHTLEYGGAAADALACSTSSRVVSTHDLDDRKEDGIGPVAWPGATPEAEEPVRRSTRTGGEEECRVHEAAPRGSHGVVSAEATRSGGGGGATYATPGLRTNRAVPDAEAHSATAPQPASTAITPLRSSSHSVPPLATSPAILPSVQATWSMADVLELHESRLRVAVLYLANVNKALQNAQLCHLINKKDAENLSSAVPSSTCAASTSKSGSSAWSNAYGGKGSARVSEAVAVNSASSVALNGGLGADCSAPTSSEEAVLRVMTTHWQRVKLMLLACVLAAEMAYRPAQRWQAAASQAELGGASLPKSPMGRDLWSSRAREATTPMDSWNTSSSNKNCYDDDHARGSTDDARINDGAALCKEDRWNAPCDRVESLSSLVECEPHAEMEQPRQILIKLLGDKFHVPVEQWIWTPGEIAVQDALHDSTLANMIQHYSSVDSKQRACHGGTVENLIVHILTTARQDGQRLSCLPSLLHEHARDGKQPVTFDGTFRACLQTRVRLPFLPVQLGELQVGLANPAQGMLFDSTPSPLLLLLVQSTQGKLTEQQLRHELREGLLATPWRTLPPARQRVVVDFLQSHDRVSRILEKNVSFLSQLVMWMIGTRVEDTEEDISDTRVVQLLDPIPVLASCNAMTVADAVTRFVLYDTQFIPQVGIFMREVLTHNAMTFDCFCDWLNYNCDRACKPEAPPVSRVLIMLVQFALAQCHWDLDATLKGRFNTLKMLVRRP